MFQKPVIILFDMDNTLCIPTQKISAHMIETLYKLKNYGYILGIVSGSDILKIKYQLYINENPELFTYLFTENGTKSYYKNELFHESSIIKYMGEDNYTTLINNILYILSTTNYPKKRGNFIENRSGTLNVSIIGRNCTIDERNEFNKFDNTYGLREQLIKNVQPLLDKYGLESSIGGMISIDIYPKGWDKSYCLGLIDYINNDIIFCGDRTEIGGNDYGIYIDNRLYEKHSVKNPDDCQNILIQKYIHN